jgi:hypothetical protein
LGYNNAALTGLCGKTGLIYILISRYNNFALSGLYGWDIFY